MPGSEGMRPANRGVKLTYDDYVQFRRTGIGTS
jgi:hypothetical protein